MPRPRPAPAGPARGAGSERLQKYLAQRGLGSRRAIEEWIRAQRITVNGRIAELGLKVTPQDDIRLDGRQVRTRAAASAQVFVFNRSAGDPLQSANAARDAGGLRAPLIDRLPKTAGRRFVAVSPMPGIDGGLELVTSDGALATRLQRAVHKLASEFSVRVKGLLGPDQLEGVKSGKLDRPARMVIDTVTTSEADLEGSNRWYWVTARGASGKDIRQLFERQGALVSRVMRISMGSLVLDKTLSRGQYRQLEDAEIEKLLASPAAEPAED
ncbi:MAG TPA: S4 domain-containing protein [Steroidobacteraceae bacterium]|nr:S4 domain-containing protein [Steroidobacteraceae bacterium]